MAPIKAISIIAALLACAGLAGAPAAHAERIEGIDVSRFQGKINWKQVAGEEIRFAFLQASRGSGADCAVAPDRCGPDEYYERNYRRARKAQIAVGPYHRAFAGGNGKRGVRADARKEARVFLAKVGALRPGDLRPVLDLETPFAGLSPVELRRWMRVWLADVERGLGARPLIYTNASSWKATGDTTRFAKRGYLLWVANFDVAKPLVPAANWNGLGWSIWQYTSSGRIDGIAGNVDRNVARVPLDDLRVNSPPPDSGGSSGG